VRGLPERLGPNTAIEICQESFNLPKLDYFLKFKMSQTVLSVAGSSTSSLFFSLDPKSTPTVIYLAIPKNPGYEESAELLVEPGTCISKMRRVPLKDAKKVISNSSLCLIQLTLRQSDIPNEIIQVSLKPFFNNTNLSSQPQDINLLKDSTGTQSPVDSVMDSDDPKPEVKVRKMETQFFEAPEKTTDIKLTVEDRFEKVLEQVDDIWDKSVTITADSIRNGLSTVKSLFGWSYTKPSSSALNSKPEVPVKEAVAASKTKPNNPTIKITKPDTLTPIQTQSKPPTLKTQKSESSVKPELPKIESSINTLFATLQSSLTERTSSVKQSAYQTLTSIQTRLTPPKSLTKLATNTVEISHEAYTKVSREPRAALQSICYSAAGMGLDAVSCLRSKPVETLKSWAGSMTPAGVWGYVNQLSEERERAKEQAMALRTWGLSALVFDEERVW
jgi:hypothetical protein